MAAANSGSVGRGKPLWPQVKTNNARPSVQKVWGHGPEPWDQISAVLPAERVTRIVGYKG